MENSGSFDMRSAVLKGYSMFIKKQTQAALRGTYRFRRLYDSSATTLKANEHFIP